MMQRVRRVQRARLPIAPAAPPFTQAHAPGLDGLQGTRGRTRRKRPCRGARRWGSTTKYYWCSDYRKRGAHICSNETSLREDIARTRILGALHDRFSSPKALGYLRQRIAEHLGNVGRGVNADLDERRKRLARTQDQITRLINFVADGNDSEGVGLTIKDLEAQARIEKATIKAIVDNAAAPVRLPTPDELMKRALELDAVLTGDPTRGREALRRLFENGQLIVKPQPGGTYVAESTLLPMMLFVPDPQNAEPPTTGGRGRSFTAISCAGAIRALEHVVFKSFSWPLVA